MDRIGLDNREQIIGSYFVGKKRSQARR